MSKILHKHIGLLHKSDKMQDVFKKEPMAAYRRDKTLQYILFHGTFRKVMGPQRRKCNPGCKTCDVRTEDQPNCTERDVIYGLTCTLGDKIVYVGETGRELRERMEEHLRDIRLKKEKAVATHFNSNGHTANNFKVTKPEKVRGQSKSLRLIRESDWISKLNTKFPSGLNAREEKFAKCNVVF